MTFELSAAETWRLPNLADQLTAGLVAPFVEPGQHARRIALDPEDRVVTSTARVTAPLSETPAAQPARAFPPVVPGEWTSAAAWSQPDDSIDLTNVRLADVDLTPSARHIAPVLRDLMIRTPNPQTREPDETVRKVFGPATVGEDALWAKVGPMLLPGLVKTIYSGRDEDALHDVVALDDGPWMTDEFRARVLGRLSGLKLVDWSAAATAHGPQRVHETVRLNVRDKGANATTGVIARGPITPANGLRAELDRGVGTGGARSDAQDLWVGAFESFAPGTPNRTAGDPVAGDPVFVADLRLLLTAHRERHNVVYRQGMKIVNAISRAFGGKGDAPTRIIGDSLSREVDLPGAIRFTVPRAAAVESGLIAPSGALGPRLAPGKAPKPPTRPPARVYADVSETTTAVPTPSNTRPASPRLDQSEITLGPTSGADGRWASAVVVPQDQPAVLGWESFDFGDGPDLSLALPGEHGEAEPQDTTQPEVTPEYVAPVVLGVDTGSGEIDLRSPDLDRFADDVVRLLVHRGPEPEHRLRVEFTGVSNGHRFVRARRAFRRAEQARDRFVDLMWDRLAEQGSLDLFRGFEVEVFDGGRTLPDLPVTDVERPKAVGVVRSDGMRLPAEDSPTAADAVLDGIDDAMSSPLARLKTPAVDEVHYDRTGRPVAAVLDDDVVWERQIGAAGDDTHIVLAHRDVDGRFPAQLRLDSGGQITHLRYDDGSERPYAVAVEGRTDHTVVLNPERRAFTRLQGGFQAPMSDFTPAELAKIYHLRKDQLLGNAEILEHFPGVRALPRMTANLLQSDENQVLPGYLHPNVVANRAMHLRARGAFANALGLRPGQEIHQRTWARLVRNQSFQDPGYQRLLDLKRHERTEHGIDAWLREVERARGEFVTTLRALRAQHSRGVAVQPDPTAAGETSRAAAARRAVPVVDSGQKVEFVQVGPRIVWVSPAEQPVSDRELMLARLRMMAPHPDATTVLLGTDRRLTDAQFGGVAERITSGRLASDLHAAGWRGGPVYVLALDSAKVGWIADLVASTLNTQAVASDTGDWYYETANPGFHRIWPGQLGRADGAKWMLHRRPGTTPWLRLNSGSLLELGVAGAYTDWRARWSRLRESRSRLVEETTWEADRYAAEERQRIADTPFGPPSADHPDWLLHQLGEAVAQHAAALEAERERAARHPSGDWLARHIEDEFAAVSSFGREISHEVAVRQRRNLNWQWRALPVTAIVPQLPSLATQPVAVQSAGEGFVVEKVGQTLWIRNSDSSRPWQEAQLRSYLRDLAPAGREVIVLGSSGQPLASDVLTRLARLPRELVGRMLGDSGGLPSVVLPMGDLAVDGSSVLRLLSQHREWIYLPRDGKWELDARSSDFSGVRPVNGSRWLHVRRDGSTPLMHSVDGRLLDPPAAIGDFWRQAWDRIETIARKRAANAANAADETAYAELTDRVTRPVIRFDDLADDHLARLRGVLDDDRETAGAAGDVPMWLREVLIQRVAAGTTQIDLIDSVLAERDPLWRPSAAGTGAANHATLSSAYPAVAHVYLDPDEMGISSDYRDFIASLAEEIRLRKEFQYVVSADLPAVELTATWNSATREQRDLAVANIENLVRDQLGDTGTAIPFEFAVNHHSTGRRDIHLGADFRLRTDDHVLREISANLNARLNPRAASEAADEDLRRVAAAAAQHGIRGGLHVARQLGDARGALPDAAVGQADLAEQVQDGESSTAAVTPHSVPGPSASWFRALGLDPAQRLLDGLNRVARPLKLHDDPSLRKLGPDVFGLLEPPPAPEFLRDYPWGELTADKWAGFLHRMDIRRPVPTRDEILPAALASGPVVSYERTRATAFEIGWSSKGLPALPSVLEIPLVINRIWFRHALPAAGPGAIAWQNIARTHELYDEFAQVLWTTVSREDVVNAEADDDRYADLREMLAKAEQLQLTLVNPFEVFNTALTPEFLSEWNQLVPRKLASASDHLRIKLPGVYSDLDNEIGPGLVEDLVITAEDHGGIAYYGGTNAAHIMAFGHPAADLVAARVRGRYELSRGELRRYADEMFPGTTHRYSTSLRARPRRFAMSGPSARQPGSITIGHTNSWVPGGAAEAGLPAQDAAWAMRGEAELTELAKRVVAMLIRGISNLDGTLDLVQASEAMRGLQPEVAQAVLTAAMRFLAERPQLSSLVTAVHLNSVWRREPLVVPDEIAATINIDHDRALWTDDGYLQAPAAFDGGVALLPTHERLLLSTVVERVWVGDQLTADARNRLDDLAPLIAELAGSAELTVVARVSPAMGWHAGQLVDHLVRALAGRVNASRVSFKTAHDGAGTPASAKIEVRLRISRTPYLAAFAHLLDIEANHRAAFNAVLEQQGRPERLPMPTVVAGPHGQVRAFADAVAARLPMVQVRWVPGSSRAVPDFSLRSVEPSLLDFVASGISTRFNPYPADLPEGDRARRDAEFSAVRQALSDGGYRAAEVLATRFGKERGATPRTQQAGGIATVPSDVRRWSDRWIEGQSRPTSLDHAMTAQLQQGTHLAFLEREASQPNYVAAALLADRLLATDHEMVSRVAAWVVTSGVDYADEMLSWVAASANHIVGEYGLADAFGAVARAVLLEDVDAGYRAAAEIGQTAGAEYPYYSEGDRAAEAFADVEAYLEGLDDPFESPISFGSDDTESLAPSQPLFQDDRRSAEMRLSPYADITVVQSTSEGLVDNSLAVVDEHAFAEWLADGEWERGPLQVLPEGLMSEATAETLARFAAAKAVPVAFPPIGADWTVHPDFGDPVVTGTARWRETGQGVFGTTDWTGRWVPSDRVVSAVVNDVFLVLHNDPALMAEQIREARSLDMSEHGRLVVVILPVADGRFVPRLPSGDVSFDPQHFPVEALKDLIEERTAPGERPSLAVHVHGWTAQAEKLRTIGDWMGDGLPDSWLQLAAPGTRSFVDSRGRLQVRQDDGNPSEWALSRSSKGPRDAFSVELAIRPDAADPFGVQHRGALTAIAWKLINALRTNRALGLDAPQTAVHGPLAEKVRDAIDDALRAVLGPEATPLSSELLAIPIPAAWQDVIRTTDTLLAAELGLVSATSETIVAVNWRPMLPIHAGRDVPAEVKGADPTVQALLTAAVSGGKINPAEFHLLDRIAEDLTAQFSDRPIVVTIEHQHLESARYARDILVLRTWRHLLNVAKQNGAAHPDRTAVDRVMNALAVQRDDLGDYVRIRFGQRAGEARRLAGEDVRSVVRTADGNTAIIIAAADELRRVKDLMLRNTTAPDARYVVTTTARLIIGTEAVPWRGPVVYVVVHGQPDHVVIAAADGRQGRTTVDHLAELVGPSVRALHRSHPDLNVVLMCCYLGAGDLGEQLAGQLALPGASYWVTSAKAVIVPDGTVGVEGRPGVDHRWRAIRPGGRAVLPGSLPGVSLRRDPYYLRPIAIDPDWDLPSNIFLLDAAPAGNDRVHANLWNGKEFVDRAIDAAETARLLTDGALRAQDGSRWTPDRPLVLLVDHAMPFAEQLSAALGDDATVAALPARFSQNANSGELEVEIEQED
ncbi:hypothetical protein ABT279_10195 [Amycolatopsis sp. NPDC000673]|uniref:hypothetical protein n=1 Tax=Amycolatopsis sp. NPDC000673 TaxID=3154267 RepID=UPI00331B386C